MADIDIERTSLRTCMVGGLRASDSGAHMNLAGWVHRRRDLGGILFVDLRDRSGLVQVSFKADWTEPDSMELAHRISHEDVIRIEGVVHGRPQGSDNVDMATGEVEVRATRLEILSDARTPAIPVYRAAEHELPAEELRLLHRALDLRRSELQQALILRHKLLLATRNY
ncbi:MAG: OB-fold nucleic acid binding domain-containing protein [Gemmatimonadetes bacterium]|nr:OB-fold nucleic acid binding domain-containing protein [Gemmatimonadota bacterium]